MLDEGILWSHNDILQNLSVFSGKCPVCMKQRGGRLANERPSVNVLCSCGTEFELPNRMSWH